ncbi:hypothetical protein ACFU99_35595 [Streptomyces sp. NPDC057654]|uniref:DUF7848 domain-containing protein n=1 Tax=Streptomyces sp. NPDC057654 TaxID=3346196 RepID=UPI0036AC77C2
MNELSVVCVSGDDVECKAESGVYVVEAPAEEWMRRHTQATGHKRYRWSYGRYMLVEPPSDFTGVTVIGQVAPRALPPGDGAA